MNFISDFVRILCELLTFAIFVRVILSWFAISPNNRLVYLLHQVTEPILAPLRGIIPRIGMIDITPIIAIILLQIIASLV